MERSKKETSTNKERCKKYRENLFAEGGPRLKKYLDNRREAEKTRYAKDKAKKMSMKKRKALMTARNESVKRSRQKKRDAKFPAVKYNQTVLVPPEPADPAMDLLKELNTYLSKKRDQIWIEFDLHCQLQMQSSINVTGIRYINGKRYEVFLSEAARQGTGIFDWLLGEVEKKRSNTELPVSKARINDLRQSIIVFANRRALKDGRVPRDTIFQNHALIINLDACDDQDAHIDLANGKHYQFGLLCTDKVFGTVEFVPQEPRIRAGGSLRNVWTDIPKKLDAFLSREPYTAGMIQQFGSLLSELKSTSEESHQLPIGTLLSMPGNVTHAGPGSDKLRAVLFFTGTPNEGTPYSSEIQHTRTTLIGELLLYNWVPLQDEPNYAAHRIYLLTKWNEIGLEQDKFAVENMNHKHLITFAKSILAAKGNGKK